MHHKLQEFWDSFGPQLVKLNAVGGRRPMGYGYITGNSSHPYGRTGLEKEEYFEHTRLNSYLDGMLAVLGSAEAEEFFIKVNAELERVTKSGLPSNDGAPNLPK